MPRVVPLELTESEREGRKAIIKKGADGRERDRAETIRLLTDGHTVQTVGEQQALCREAVRSPPPMAEAGVREFAGPAPVRSAEQTDGGPSPAIKPLG